MVTGEPVPGPFKHRLLVPALASVLPLAPLLTFKLITYAATFLGYFVAFLTLRCLRFSILTAAASLLLLAGTLRQLVLLQNPYVTDACSFLSLNLLVFFLVRRAPLAFAITAMVAVLAREDAIFLAPAFFAFGSWRRATLIVAVILGAYLIPRALSPGLLYDWMGLRPLGGFSYWAKLFGASGWVLLTLPLGLPILKTRSREVLGVFLLGLGGTVASTILAADTARMVLPLAPTVGICIAAVFSHLAGSPLRWLVAVLILGGPLCVIPNVFFPGNIQPPPELEMWYVQHAPLVLGYQALGGVFILMAAYHISPLWSAEWNARWSSRWASEAH